MTEHAERDQRTLKQTRAWGRNPSEAAAGHSGEKQYEALLWTSSSRTRDTCKINRACAGMRSIISPMRVGQACHSSEHGISFTEVAGPWAGWVAKSNCNFLREVTARRAGHDSHYAVGGSLTCVMIIFVVYTLPL